MSEFADHFSAIADAYSAHRPRYPRALAEWLGDVAPARGVVWEAGCGSGQLSTLLGDVFARVEATDASAAQIEHADVHPHVHYRVAPAEASGLPAATGEFGMHAAVAAQAAHWFDIERYYDEVRRVVRPGGVVALVGYGLGVITPEVDAAVLAFYEDVLGPHWAPQRRHIEAGYRTLPFPFEPLDPPELEMCAEWRLDGLLGYVTTWSAIRALERAEGKAAAERAWRGFREAAAEAWGDPTLERMVRWPLVVRAGRV